MQRILVAEISLEEKLRMEKVNGRLAVEGKH